MCINSLDTDSRHESEPNVDGPGAFHNIAFHHERNAPSCVFWPPQCLDALSRSWLAGGDSAWTQGV